MIKVITKVKQVLLCFMLCSFAIAQADYPPVAPNVPYSKVAELMHDAWSAKYSYGEHSEQFVLHWPALSNNADANKRNKTALVFIHGGCWLQQFTIEHSLPLTSAFAQAGFEVFSAEHRRSGNGGEWPVALEDITLALDFIQSRLEQTKTQLVLMGHSAGGHLASLAAIKAQSDNTKVHFIGLAPIMDIVNYAKGDNSCQTATPAFMSGTPDTAATAYQQANPIHYDLGQLASATIFAGGQDTIVPIAYAQHKNANVVLAQNAGHFDWIHPGSDAFKRLIAQLDTINSTD